MRWEYGVAHRYPKRPWEPEAKEEFTAWRTDWYVIDDESDEGKGAVHRMIERAQRLTALAESEGTGNQYRVVRRPYGEGEIVWPWPEEATYLSLEPRPMTAAEREALDGMQESRHQAEEAT